MFMRTVKQIIASDFISGLSLAAFSTYAYWYLYEITRNQSVVSAMGFVSMLGAFGAMIGGYIVDQNSKVGLLRGIAMTRLLAGVVLLLVALTQPGKMIAVVLLMTVNVFLGMVYSPLSESIAPTFVQDTELVTANSWISLTTQVGSVASAGLAALFVYLKQPALVIACMLVTIGISLISLLWIKKDPRPMIERSSSTMMVIRNMFSGLGLIRQNRLVFMLIPIALIMNLSYFTVWLLMPKYCVDLFSSFKYTYNLIDVGYTIGGIAGAALLTMLGSKLRGITLFPLYLAGQSFALVLLGIVPLVLNGFYGVAAVSFAWVLYGMCNSMAAVVYFSGVQSSGSRATVGKLVGAVLTVFSLANPVAAIISAPLARVVSLPVLIIIFGVIMLASSLVLWTPKYRGVLSVNETNQQG
jgi:MFS family permease